MGLFNDLFGTNKKEQTKSFGLFSFMEEERQKNKGLEQEMNNYGLDEWQKELVRKGEYNPCNFEEDGDLEEDDYYYEDD